MRNSLEPTRTIRSLSINDTDSLGHMALLQGMCQFSATINIYISSIETGDREPKCNSEKAKACKFNAAREGADWKIYVCSRIYVDSMSWKRTSFLPRAGPSPPRSRRWPARTLRSKSPMRLVTTAEAAPHTDLRTRHRNTSLCTTDCTVS